MSSTCRCKFLAPRPQLRLRITVFAPDSDRACRRSRRRAVRRGRPVTAVRACAASIDDELIEFSEKGPLWGPCGLSAISLDKQQWLNLGDELIKGLGFEDRESLSLSQRARIFQYYLPVFFWCQGQLQQHRAKRGNQRPLVLGMQAVQGCGKTTLVEQLERLFEVTGERAASVSIDDFYLTFQDQQALSKSHAGNRLWAVRGNAGTHDLVLGQQTLEALQGATSGATEVAIPRYDKSQNDGRGDRAKKEHWARVKGPVDIVLFEGWMLGFAPLSAEVVAEVDQDLVDVNERLRKYADAWDSKVDSWLIIEVADMEYVYTWRLQAEHAMKAKGQPGMSDNQVKDFVDRYMPAYKAYLPGMYSQGPTTARPGHILKIKIDKNRGLTPTQPEVLDSEE